MSGRVGTGQQRPAASGPQPLKATVPFKLTSKPRASRREGKSAGKTKSQQMSPGMRRTMSLDAIIGPYLQGHWPKEPEGSSREPRKDKSTQTPESWWDDSQGRRSGNIHKRSASWGSAEHLREIAKLKHHLQRCSKPTVLGAHEKDRHCTYPHGSCSLGATQTQPIPIPLTPLSTLVPRLRCSVEGLNQELEGMFISHSPLPHHRFLEVPDGHRAPVPSNGSSIESQSELTVTPQSCSSSPSSSLCSSSCSSPSLVGSSQSNAADVSLDLQLVDGRELSFLTPSSPSRESDPCFSLTISSSPGPNKSYCFQREPPEGCEKVKVWEELSDPLEPKPTLLSSCPDPNKVNFTPHGGSAFCPVSLLKPLLPSMDLLFRSITVSPTSTCSSHGASLCQVAPSGSRMSGTDASTASTVMGENSEEGLAF